MSGWSDERLGELVGAHFRAARDRDEERGLEQIAVALATGDDRAIAEAAKLAERIPGCTEALLWLPRLEDAPPEPIPLASRRRIPRVLPALAAAFLLGVIGTSALTFHPNPPSELSPKGAADRIALAVERDGHRFHLGEGDQLLAGDRIGFFYDASSAGAVLVLHRDEAGTVTPVTRGRIERPATHVPLDDGAVATPGQGCEWVVAFFADGPIDEARAIERVRAGKVSAGCRLDVDRGSARAISIVPVRR